MYDVSTDTGANDQRAVRDGLIDIHAHFVPENFPSYKGRKPDARWPSMQPGDAGWRNVMLGGVFYRRVPAQCWRVDEMIQGMVQRQVSLQVLSPMPELLSYWLDPEDGAVLCRYLNEEAARLVAMAPQRLAGLGAVPLQDVGLAIRELEVAVGELQLAGVEIGTNVNGVPIGHPQFAPFFEAAEALGASLFIHPLRPAGLDRLVGPVGLEQVVAFPGETALAAASLITGGTLAKFPGLRIAFSHGGGSFSSVLPRLQYAWETFPSFREQVAVEPCLAARKLFYDSAVYDAGAFQHLVQVFGEDQIVIGTDAPFAIMERNPQGRLQALEADTTVKQLIGRDNALRWLRLNGRG
ncbi:amidohydrolase family protein [Pandoraea fibrosis]|uniref:2-amino-3-carboxymuconate-6-semialdehyde decarboxylase n=1 Tax=Pandoraea fibrosis TaxID=1891094 RepID=A0ABX6HWQ1_9BURK|nr:amidohydrolase family protein [Pandoraea fibrosis]QHE91522.1 amidohydrolase family protein [Pandoraea fibrosis]QHF14920.1 amidohydrolase family protein [Pandoraea fibrosis]